LRFMFFSLERCGTMVSTCSKILSSLQPAGKTQRLPSSHSGDAMDHSEIKLSNLLKCRESCVSALEVR